MIGTHSVSLTPDPNVPVWSAAIASNPNMTTDIAGWKAAPFANAWTWAAPGVAKAPAVAAGSAGLYRADTHGVARGPVNSLFRLRVTTTVNKACWIIPQVFLGTSAVAAYQGPFWQPNDAVALAKWFWAPSAGTYSLEAILDTSAQDPRYTFVGPCVDYLWEGGGAAQPVVNVDTMELTRQTFGTTVDISCLVDEVTIKHGRAETTGQPEASSATLDMSWDTDEDQMPDGIDVGSIIRVTTTLPGLASSRFVGKVTDITYGWDEAGEETPETVVAQVVAVGELGDMGRRIVGDTPWPQESDGARIARIITASGVQTSPAYVDAGTVQVNPRDVDAQSALDLAQSIAQSAGGILWMTRSGLVQYADAAHRTGATAGLRLDVCDILVTPVWQRNTDGLVNGVSIGYGVPTADEEGGSEQPRWTETDPTSQGRYGRYEYSSATELAALADAQALARLLLVRNARPVWVLTALPVDVAGLDSGQTTQLLSMDVNDLLEVTGLPAVGNAPTATSLWVEGWSERLAFGVHELEINVSGYCRTAPPPQWDGVPPVWTWDTIGVMTWNEASCFGPAPSSGRWVDQPASTKWDQLTNTQTWDTYTGATNTR